MTGIIATLGPKTSNKEMITDLHQAGVDIFRLNFAHETIQSGMKAVNIIRNIEKKLGQKIRILMDVEGPGIRTGVLIESISYVAGEQFKIFTTQNISEKKSLFCDYPSLPDDVKIGSIVKIDAGLFQVQVLGKGTDFISVQALNDFVVGSRRHINLPGIHVKLPSFTDKDKQDVLFAIQEKLDYVALSFVRSAADMRELRAFLDLHGGKKIQTVAKIENEEGLKNISAIAKESDIIMVARGDLGTELPVENIPIYQMDIINATKQQNKKVIVATEMLESMLHSATPKRADISDIFYAVIEGADYVMLSGETAVGEYPVECVKVMNKVILAAEKYK
ncbi:MAG: pyruvate kinase [Candidatus Absconditabacterales bacterium]